MASRVNVSTAFAALVILGLLVSRTTFAADGPVLRSNYSGISAGFVPVWIAYDKGLFSKYGLNIDLQFIAPATATVVEAVSPSATLPELHTNVAERCLVILAPPPPTERELQFGVALKLDGRS